MTKTLDELPIFAWAHNARPEIVHYEVKSLWLKVSAQQVENYIEPLVLLEDVRSALRELIADAERKKDHVYEAASWAELTTDQLQLLPRRLLDLACRVRTNETLFRDDALIDIAAHALNGFLRQYTAEAKADTAIANAQRPTHQG